MVEQKAEQPIKEIANAASQAARAETAPAHTRRYRAILFQFSLLIIIAAFAVLTFLVKTTASFPIDLQITKSLQSINIPLFSTLMIAVSWPGFYPQSILIAGLIIVLIYSFGLRWEAVMGLIAAILSTAIGVLVKDLIQRPRPAAALVHVLATINSSSFPSGHVMFYTGFFGFIGFLAFSLLKPSLKRSLLMVLFGGLVILIGVSRIYVGEHWASDVVGAYLLGSLTLAATILVYRWGKTRFFVHQPVATDESQKG